MRNADCGLRNGGEGGLTPPSLEGGLHTIPIIFGERLGTVPRSAFRNPHSPFALALSRLLIPIPSCSGQRVVQGCYGI